MAQNDNELKIEHGFQWIVLSAPAWAALPPGRLRNLLHYVMTGEPNGDDFTERLAAAVSKANENELWRREKMEMLTFEEDLEIQKAIAVAEARAEGLAEGRAEAIAETEEKFASLANALLAAGREGDVARAATDPKIREALYREFDLND